MALLITYLNVSGLQINMDKIISENQTFLLLNLEFIMYLKKTHYCKNNNNNNNNINNNNNNNASSLNTPIPGILKDC